MRKIVLAVLMLLPVSALATEVLVSNVTATRVDGASTSYRRGVEVQNQGPNAVWCNVGTSTVVVNKARQVSPGEAWFFPVRVGVPVYCLASTAAQVTGAATIATEAVAEVPVVWVAVSSSSMMVWSMSRLRTATEAICMMRF